MSENFICNVSRENWKRSAVYLITEKTSGKIYVGRAVNIRTRYNSHSRGVRMGKGDPSVTMRNYFLKHPNSLFEMTILEFVDKKEDLMEREQYYLDTLKPWDRKIGFNISKNACPTPKGSPKKGHHKNKGRKRSEEEKAAYRKARAHLSFSIAHISPTGEVKIYEDSYEASRQTQLHNSIINKIARGVMKPCRGNDFYYTDVSLMEKYAKARVNILTRLGGPPAFRVKITATCKISGETQTFYGYKEAAKSLNVSIGTVRDVCQQKRPATQKYFLTQEPY